MVISIKINATHEEVAREKKKLKKLFSDFNENRNQLITTRKRFLDLVMNSGTGFGKR